jgi:hypothetical protein
MQRVDQSRDHGERNPGTRFNEARCTSVKEVMKSQLETSSRSRENVQTQPKAITEEVARVRSAAVVRIQEKDGS